MPFGAFYAQSFLFLLPREMDCWFGEVWQSGCEGNPKLPEDLLSGFGSGLLWSMVCGSEAFILVVLKTA